MKFRVALISVLCSFLGGIAQADTIFVSGERSVRQPTIIRGAPLRCYTKRPQIINVQLSLKNASSAVPKCIDRVQAAHRARPKSIINLIIIAGRYEHLYIKHY